VETVASRYRLIERLGAGGMSVVWRAYDDVLGRPVAVKLLAPQWSGDADFRARVHREARAAARLTHPNITNVYDYGEAADGTPYVVMELVEGQSLAQRLAAGPLAWRSAARVAGQVAAALAAAHAQGIVHRDITPGNVMLSRTGVKVVDFGIAAMVGERDRAVLGTPTYLAPEQRAGGPAQPASDVYALGLLLYHCATGQVPRQVSLGRLPSELAAVIRSCLVPDPASRPGSAVLARRLGELAGDAVIVPVPGPGPAPVRGGTRVMAPQWVPRRPRRLPWALVAVVALVLTFLAGVLYAGARHSPAVADPAAPPSTTRPSTHPPSPRLGCRVTYTVSASVGAEFGAEVKIENSGPIDINGWTLVFDLPEDQAVRFGWAGRWDQQDRTVTVQDAVYNRSLAPGKSTTVRFAGTHGGTAKPKRFTVNGVRCITAS
jgi:eukaryotic-like serine/threonine-protein kinase